VPAGVLSIEECTEQMQLGGKKNAEYIYKKIRGHMMEIDPDRDLVDLLYFDGASNVQKAGRVLEVDFPKCTTLHGVEHLCSLFFADVCKHPRVRLLLKVYRRIYRLLGSGSHHGPYAIFMKHSSDHNGGRRIGLLRAADTRMAGHFIAFSRLLRLRNAILSCIASAEWKQTVSVVDFVVILLFTLHTNQNIPFRLVAGKETRQPMSYPTKRGLLARNRKTREVPTTGTSCATIGRPEATRNGQAVLFSSENR